MGFQSCRANRYQKRNWYITALDGKLSTFDDTLRLRGQKSKKFRHKRKHDNIPTIK